MDPNILKRRAGPLIRSFYEAGCRMVEDAGAHCYDLHLAIPHERFLTMGHFDEEGHRMMGRLVSRIVREELQ